MSTLFIFFGLLFGLILIEGSSSPTSSPTLSPTPQVLCELEVWTGCSYTGSYYKFTPNIGGIGYYTAITAWQPPPIGTFPNDAIKSWKLTSIIGKRCDVVLAYDTLTDTTTKYFPYSINGEETSYDCDATNGISNIYLLEQYLDSLIPFVRYRFNNGQRIYLSREANDYFGGCTENKFKIEYYNGVGIANDTSLGLDCGTTNINDAKALNLYNIGKEIIEKTFEVELLVRGTRAGGGVFGIDQEYPNNNDTNTYHHTNFDSLVYGERVSKQFMAGSELFRRTILDNGGELIDPYNVIEPLNEQFIHFVVTYKKVLSNGRTLITIYKDGSQYAQYETNPLPVYKYGYRLLFCERHAAPGTSNTVSFDGIIKQASIFDFALTSDQAKRLYYEKDLTPLSANVCDEST